MSGVSQGRAKGSVPVLRVRRTRAKASAKVGAVLGYQAARRGAKSLLDYRPPFGTQELAGATGSSAAMISRVSSLPEPDEIVTKESLRGRIVLVDWESMTRRWAMDYDFASSNVLTTWREPRGTRALFSQLRDTGIRYAITGSFAGYRLAPIAESRLAALYVDDPNTTAQSLGLRWAESCAQHGLCADGSGPSARYRPAPSVGDSRARRTRASDRAPDRPPVRLQCPRAGW